MIDGISGRPAGLIGSSVRVDAAGTQAAGVAKAAKADPGEAAPRAELAALATAAREASSAPVDKARVAEIREAIANGSYPVNPEKIAARMVEPDLGWTEKGDSAE